LHNRRERVYVGRNRPEYLSGENAAVFEHVSRLLDGFRELFRLAQVLHNELRMIQKLGDLSSERTRLSGLRSLREQQSDSTNCDYALAHR
jgi:hypothetical protein